MYTFLTLISCLGGGAETATNNSDSVCFEAGRNPLETKIAVHDYNELWQKAVKAEHVKTVG